MVIKRKSRDFFLKINVNFGTEVICLTEIANLHDNPKIRRLYRYTISPNTKTHLFQNFLKIVHVPDFRSKVALLLILDILLCFCRRK